MVQHYGILAVDQVEFPTHAPLQLTSPSPSFHRRLGVPSVSSPILSGLPDVDLAAAVGDMIYHIELLTKRC